MAEIQYPDDEACACPTRPFTVAFQFKPRVLQKELMGTCDPSADTPLAALSCQRQSRGQIVDAISIGKTRRNPGPRIPVMGGDSSAAQRNSPL